MSFHSIVDGRIFSLPYNDGSHERRLKKKYKNYFSAKPQCTVENFGELNYIAITGSGKPHGNKFTKAVGALYAAAYSVKDYCKR